jgi:signal transduction histidine kinase
MKNWPLKLKFGLGAVVLTILLLVAATAWLIPFIGKKQTGAIAEKLRQGVDEIIRGIENYENRPSDVLRRPIDRRFIPPSLTNAQHYYQILGINDVENLRSENLGKATLAKMPLGESKILIHGSPCLLYATEHGYMKVFAAVRLENVVQLQQQILFAAFLVIPLASIAAYAAGWWLANSALRPVSKIIATARTITAGNANERLSLPSGRDELYDLTEVLNDAFDRLQNSYATASQFSSDASHQLKTPISILRLDIDDLAKSDNLTAAQEQKLQGLLKQTRRLDSIVTDLLLLAQLDAGRLALARQPTDLIALVLAALDDASVIAEDKAFTLTQDLSPQLIALADPSRVSLILQNLFENAVKYTPAGGTIHVRAYSLGLRAIIAVSNTCPPIPAAHHQKLFDRFYRATITDNAKGQGLGLNIAQSLAKAQQGDLTLRRSDATGTEFQLTLPLDA